MAVLGKKGDDAGTSNMFLTIVQIVFAAAVILGIISIIFNGTVGTKEELLATDLGLSLMLVESMPYSIDVHYSPFLDDFTLNLEESVITVESEQSEQSYRMQNIEAVSRTNGFFSNFNSIPINFDGQRIDLGTVDFDDQREYCRDLPTSFDSDLKVIINNEAETLRQTLSSSIGFFRGPNFEVTFSESLSDYKINIDIIEGGEDGKQVRVYYNDEEEVVDYRKLSCFLSANIRQEMRENDLIEGFSRNTDFDLVNEMNIEIHLSDEENAQNPDFVREVVNILGISLNEVGGSSG